MRQGEEQLSCSEINVVSAVELLGHSSIKQQHNGQHHGGAIESWSNIMLRSRGRHRADGSSVAVQLHPSSSPSYFSLSSFLPHSVIGQSLMNGLKIKQIGKVSAQEKTNKVQ